MRSKQKKGYSIIMKRRSSLRDREEIIMLYNEMIDMRKSIKKLRNIMINKIKENLLEDRIYVFLNRKKKIKCFIKIK